MMSLRYFSEPNRCLKLIETLVVPVRRKGSETLSGARIDDRRPGAIRVFLTVVPPPNTHTSLG